MPTATAEKATRADQARAQILRALPGPKGGQWATARAVAEVVDMGYSTVTEHLRAMVEAGTVATTKQGRSSVFRKNGPSPKLRKTDTVAGRAATVGGNPLAEQIVNELTKPLTVCGRSMRTGLVVREVPMVELGGKACEKCYPDDELPPDGSEPSGRWVWVAVVRKGATYHRPQDDLRDDERVEVDKSRGDAEFPPDGPEPAAVPQPPAAARTPAGAGVGDTVAFLESVRPVSAAPAAPEPQARAPRTVKADRPPYAVWGRGELQVAILGHLRATPESLGTWFTPTQVARSLNSHAGAVAYALDRLVVKGEAVKADDSPQRYQTA